MEAKVVAATTFRAAAKQAKFFSIFDRVEPVAFKPSCFCYGEVSSRDVRSICFIGGRRINMSEMPKNRSNDSPRTCVFPRQHGPRWRTPRRASAAPTSPRYRVHTVAKQSVGKDTTERDLPTFTTKQNSTLDSRKGARRVFSVPPRSQGCRERWSRLRWCP